LRTIVSTILIVALAATAGRPQGSDGRAARLREMRAIAESVTMVRAGPGGSRPLSRLAEPIYRFDDAARSFFDGTVWAWGQPGRPAAVLTLARQRASTGGYRYLCELTSLAPGPISARVADVAMWEPSVAGIVMQDLPGAPPLASDPPRRLLQMKEFVRQVKAHEFYKPRDQPTVQRYELRLLPVPVLRYSDEPAGLVDGAMFVIAYGLNPELLLLVEASQKGPSGPVWSYGIGRISSAELHVDFQGKELWSHPGSVAPKSLQDPYWTFARPSQGE
jgi:hypothetical protein